MHMEAGSKLEVPDHHGWYTGNAHQRMFGEQMSAAGGAPFASTHNRFIARAGIAGKATDEMLAFGDMDAIGVSQGESIHRAGGPAAMCPPGAITTESPGLIHASASG